MNKRFDYNTIIDEIEKKGNLVIDQKLAKRIAKNEIPKSCFDYNYLKNGRNELGRFLIKNKNIYEFEIIPAQIIIRKK